jgi:putative ABC transport system permease protein
MKLANKQSFGWTIQMIVPVGVLAQAVGLAGVATLVAGYFPARWAAQQPVVGGRGRNKKCVTAYAIGPQAW